MSGDIRTRERAFAAWTTGLVLAVMLLGFARSFFLLPLFPGSPEWAAKEAIFYAHGAIFTAWFALLATQVALIRLKNPGLHRRLGYVGAGLGALVFVVGVLASMRAANRPGGFIDVPFPPDQFLASQILGMLLFGILVLLAVIWRKDSARHKRLMLLACISLLGAPVARITSMVGPLAPPMFDLIVYSALIALMLVWDAATQRRVRGDTLIGGAFVVGVNVVALPIGATAGWLAISHWLMSLVPPP